MDRLCQLATLGAAAALDGVAAPTDRTRAGVIIGSAFGAHLSNQLFYSRLLAEGAEAASPTAFAYTLASAAAAELSLQLGLAGPTFTLAQGPTAGLAALALASEQIDDGRADWMLVGGADVSSGALVAAMPDDALTEAAVFFVLTRERTDGSLARVAGSGASRRRDGRERAMAQALARAGLAGEGVETVVAPPTTAAEPLWRLTDSALLRSADGDKTPMVIVVDDPRAGSRALCLRPPDA